MRALLFIQASLGGLSELSATGRAIPSSPSRVSLINGKPYYDLNGDSVWSWSAEPEFNTDAKFTIEMWAVLSEGDYQAIFASLQQSSAEKGILFFVGNSNARLVNGGATGNDEQLVSFATTANDPTHIAWVMDGINKKLYLNGAMVSSSVIISAPSKTPYQLIFGGNQNFVTNVPYASSKAKVSQFVFWDDVKYTENFTPKYEKYVAPTLLTMGGKNNVFSKIFTVYHDARIFDKVLIKGVPSKRKVCLYHRSTNELIATKWSDEAGNYRFDNLRPNTEYYVLALDHERNYNAVIQDMLRADR